MKNSSLGMTRRGYKNKFFKTYGVLAGCGFFILIFASGVDSFTMFFLMLGISIGYTFIPSAIIALIWEFFEEK